MDSTFYKSLAALGEVGMRKASYRTRVFLVVAPIVLCLACTPLVLWKITPGLRFGGFLVGCGFLCFAIAEFFAMRRMPLIIGEVAHEHGVSAESLRADSMKHVDSAMA